MTSSVVYLTQITSSVVFLTQKSASELFSPQISACEEFIGWPYCTEKPMNEHLFVLVPTFENKTLIPDRGLIPVDFLSFTKRL